MLDAIFEFISDLLNLFYNLLFILYIIMLVIMGIVAPGYLIWELVALTIGYIIYKAKGNCFGHNATFRGVWMNATMASCLCLIFGVEVGFSLAPIARLLFIGFAYK